MLNLVFADGPYPRILPGPPPPSCAAAAAVAGYSGAADTCCDVLGGQGRVILIGRGEGPREAVRAGAHAISHCLLAPAATVDLRALSAEDAAAFLEGACLRAWSPVGLRTRPRDDDKPLTTLHVLSGAPDLPQRWARRRAAIAGALFARDLTAEPANTLTPDGFVQRLDRLRALGLEVTISRGEALVRAGMSGLLAVGGGSVHPPALVVLRWPGRGRPIAFAGKGITFDTGGVSIKPADGMWEMRTDMAGAAACAGAMMALAMRGADAPAMAVLALAENTTSGRAYRPSDVLRHADGSTIEIVDTDAEGRLVLADALGWAVRQSPAAIIDLATLTGSVVTALGHHRAGLYGNDDTLAAGVQAAGEVVGERVWRLPIGRSHREALRSDIADLRHCVPGSGHPDASQAAAFLHHFVGDTPWAHLDIAGVESRAEAAPDQAAGATGFGVRLLDRLVEDWFEAAVPA